MLLLYVSSPSGRSTRFTPPGRSVHSDTKSGSTESIDICCHYCTKTTHSHICTNVYGQVHIIQPSELGRHGANENAAGNWMRRIFRILGANKGRMAEVGE